MCKDNFAEGTWSCDGTWCSTTTSTLGNFSCESGSPTGTSEPCTFVLFLVFLLNLPYCNPVVLKYLKQAFKFNFHSKPYEYKPCTHAHTHMHDLLECNEDVVTIKKSTSKQKIYSLLSLLLYIISNFELGGVSLSFLLSWLGVLALGLGWHAHETHLCTLYTSIFIQSGLQLFSAPWEVYIVTYYQFISLNCYCRYLPSTPYYLLWHLHFSQKV